MGHLLEMRLTSPFIRFILCGAGGSMALTKRQRQVYDYIAEFVQKNGYSPSFEEIGEGMGLSSLATVHKHISNLEKKGLLRRDYNRSRSLDVLPIRGMFKRAVPKETAL